MKKNDNLRIVVAAILVSCIAMTLIVGDAAGTFAMIYALNKQNDSNGVTRVVTLEPIENFSDPAVNNTSAEPVNNQSNTQTNSAPVSDPNNSSASNESKCIDNKEHVWVEATCAKPKTCSVCGATDGEPSAHASPNSEFKCTACGQTVTASNYQYLALQDYGVIKDRYKFVVANVAGISLFEDYFGNICVLVRVSYNIGDHKFDDMFLHDYTNGNYIENPVSAYEEAMAKSFGSGRVDNSKELDCLLKQEALILLAEEQYYIQDMRTKLYELGELGLSEEEIQQQQKVLKQNEEMLKQKEEELKNRFGVGVTGNPNVYVVPGDYLNKYTP